MNPLVIRTAVPFGYLLAGVALLGLVALGAAMLAHGLWRRNHRRAGIGIAIGLFAAYVIGVNVADCDKLDLNPRVDATGVSGRWTHAGAVLVLRPNGQYECAGASACNALGALGSWSLTHGDVTLRSAPSAISQPTGVRYRVVSYDGVLQLASPIDDDPDLWDGKFYWAFGAPAA